MNFLGGSFRVGRLFGINIRIHMLFVIWVAYRLFETAGDWQFQLAWIGMVFGIVLIHEFGHCFGARAVGGGAENILLWPLGGLAYADAPMRPWPQFVTVIGGPIVHPLLCLISGAVLVMATGTLSVLPLNPLHPGGLQHLTEMWQAYVWLFFHINMWMLCFNLLPIFPFDGGQLFRTVLWQFLGLHRGTILATQVGLVGAAVLGILGAMDRDALLVGIAIFGGLTSYQHYQAARAGLLGEDFLGVDRVIRTKMRTRGFWSRLFRRRGRSSGSLARPLESPNPNPGGWAAKQADRAQEEAELDRILKKVSDQGVQSLSYVERQALERITRKRQQEEREFQHGQRP